MIAIERLRREGLAGPGARRRGRMRPVFCAYDVGDSSDEHLRQADALARAMEAPLHILHVVPNALRCHPLFPQLYGPESIELAALESRAGDLLSQRVESVTGRRPGDFRVEVETGTPYAAIVRRAEEVDALLTVVGGRPRDGTTRYLVGDTAEKVVRHAHGPVLVARPGPGSRRVLAATDLSDPSLPAVEAAADQARRTGARLTLLHVVDLRSAEIGTSVPAPPGAYAPRPPEAISALRQWGESGLAAASARCGVPTDRIVDEGVPAVAILRRAEELPADLIVIGTAGMTAVKRLLLGSVAEAVVRWAPCSVLVVRLHKSATAHV
jgi:universal stress protein E